MGVAVGLTYTNDEEYLHELAHNDFGKTIIETIQVSMHSGKDVDRIVELLKQMEEDIKSENESEKAVKGQRDEQCAKKQGEAEAAIKSANVQRVEAERAIPFMREELRDKERQAKEKLTEEQRNNDLIFALMEERKESRAEYEAQRDELGGLIGALQEAKKIVGQLKKQGFLQINDGVLAEIKRQQKRVQERAVPKKKSFHSLVNFVFSFIQ